MSGRPPGRLRRRIKRLTTEVRAAKSRAIRAANAELLGLFWVIGAEIRARQQVGGWGAKVIDRLARDLRAEFPEHRGFNRSNLYYMRAFAAAWPDRSIVPTHLGRLSWSHVRCLLDKLEDQALRDWYAARASEQGWTMAVLEHQIATAIHARLGTAPTNFGDRLDADDAHHAQQLVRDPYVFDFLDLAEPSAERDVESALMDRLQEALLEFGRGFAFVGRQVRIDVDGDDFVVDLILFHTVQLRHVVVELKVGRFKPEYTGQLGFYVAVVDDKLRRADIHAPTVGILMCASRNDAVVRYALASASAPLAVANYSAQRPVDPAALNLPRPSELTAILGTPMAGRPGTTLGQALPAEAPDASN